MISHGVEIAIAGGVGEIVCDPNSCREGALIYGFFPKP